MSRTVCEELDERWIALIYSILWGTVPEASLAIVASRLHGIGTLKTPHGRGCRLTAAEFERLCDERKHGKPLKMLCVDYQLCAPSAITNLLKWKGVQPKKLCPPEKLKRHWDDTKMYGGRR